MQSVLMAKIFGDREDPRRRLETIFGGQATAAQPPATAIEWGRGIVGDAGIDAGVDPVRATRALRGAEPRLTLRAATFLVHHL